MREGEVRYTVGKLSTIAQLEVWAKSYSLVKLQESKPRQFRDSPLGVSGQKNHLDVSATERRKEYYIGEGVGFPWIRAVVSLVSLESPVACPSTKGAP